MRICKTLVLLLSTALVVAGCNTPKALENPGPELSEYRVAPPDELWITIRPEPAERSRVIVRPDGRVSIEMIGDVDVRGKTITEIREEIRVRMEPFVVQPVVVVELAESKSRSFHVTGEVLQPGTFPLEGDMTVLDGLFLAHGGTLVASLNSARLVRPGEGVFKVRFDDIIHLGQDATNYQLRDGDLIEVPANGFGKAGRAIQILFLPVTAIFSVGRTIIGSVGAF